MKERCSLGFNCLVNSTQYYNNDACEPIALQEGCAIRYNLTAGAIVFDGVDSGILVFHYGKGDGSCRTDDKFLFPFINTRIPMEDRIILFRGVAELIGMAAGLSVVQDGEYGGFPRYRFVRHRPTD